MTSVEILTGSRRTPLPEGWRWESLGNLVHEAHSGFACGSRDPDGVIQLRMNNVDTRGNFVWDEYIRVPAHDETIEAYKLALGDVLFNNTNSIELVGKSALFEGYKEPVVYSNHFTRIRTIQNALIPEFLAAWLNHQWQMCVFENICNRWIGQSAVKPDKLLGLDFPLPPLPEQKRIAAILRERMEAVERARKYAEEQLEAATALPTAYLRDTFSDDNCKKWQSFSVGDICVSIDYGFTASADFSIEIPKFLRITDIQNGNVNWGQVPGCMINFEDEDLYILKEGDIVFTRTGATTGKSFLLKDPPRAIFASYLIRLRPNRSRILPEYLYTFFQSDRYWTQIKNQARGGAQPNFNATMLAKLNLPLPLNSEQQALIRKIDKKFCSTQKMISYIKDQLSTINALPGALLRQAFRGEL